ncbi:MAG TPA: hypothetical protein PLO37_13010 [Candidatus Hydrogenedentes bacterium]|nr:hypothetical protein [Candidatus Hydrogenedentota bacterium]HPG67763.1 hypothetical protein [Candidatus Hydrogenedentota bacterium]
MMARGTGAVCLAGVATRVASAAEAVASKKALFEVLAAVGKPCHVVTNPDGTSVLLLPYGGRVLGLFAPGSDENFYWTHPALGAEDTARAFYASADWHNSGGDRTWLAPEVDIFLPRFPDTATYWQPRQLDPGNYEAVQGAGGLELVNRLKLKLSRSGQEVELRMTKSVGPAANPLRYERKLDLAGVQYAGYTQHTRLEMLGEHTENRPMVGLWNLVQMPHGGDLLIPIFHKAEPKIWFGQIAADDLIVGDHLIRYKMRAQGEHKVGVRAVATTGRVGYLYGSGDACSLIVRSFVVNPSGEYVDAPWKDPDDLGYSTQACNVNSALGAFSELEYHIPAIGGKTGSIRCDDTAQVWAFRGPGASVLAAARCLLSPEA